ncbi:MAG: ATP synthase subunit I [Lachnospiraceae bacterium]|nr:ATP synthase subunit I [Lachnospiraceae bacterium]
MQEDKKTLYELLAGIIFCLILFLPGNFFTSSPAAYTLGLLTGGTVAAVMSMHMYRALQQAMLYDEENAAKKVQKGTILRLLLMMAALVAALVFPEWISIIGVALGVLSLKFSAYLQPLTHKFFKKFIDKGR